MERAFLLLLLIFTISCSLDDKSEEVRRDKDSNTDALQETVKDTSKLNVQVTEPSLPNYDSAIAMLESAGDFQRDEGNLKLISSDPLHIQVSSWGFTNDKSTTLIEGSIRDIVYVAFQIFAKTDFDSVTITAVPQNFDNKGSYMDSYKITESTNRKTAKEVLNKYASTSSFDDLYEYKDGIWLPSDKFAKLRFERLILTYHDLTQ